MRRMLALLLALAAVLVVLWLALHRDAPAPALAEAPPAPASETPALPPAKIEAPVEAEAQRVTAVSTPERAPVATAPASEPTQPLAELRGRILLEGGAPAVGAQLELGGWESNNERVMKFGKPKEEWKKLSAVCDAQGRFSLRFDPPRAYQFTLEASCPGRVTANWRWGEIEPASVKDLGDTVLPRGGAIAGRVVDAQGKPMPEAWSVSASAFAVSKGDGSDNARGFTQVDRTTGQFRIENLPPGSVELQAHSELANWIKGPTVEVRAGETVEATITYTGPDNSKRITIITTTHPFYIFSSQVDEIRLSAPGHETRKAQKIARSSQSFSFDDLEPGSYSVTIDDPKFKPWRQDGVQPGQRVTAKLEGASSVSLAVVDALTRAPLAHYALRVRFDDSSWRPNQFELFGADAEPPAGGLVGGLIPGQETLLVLAEGYAPCELKLADLKRDEVRPLTAELRKGTTLVARVLQSDGKTPIAGSKVTLDPSPPEGQNPNRRVNYRTPPDQREAQSDAQGRASFPALPAGKYDLRCEITPLLAAQVKGFEIAVGDTEKSVDLVLPPNGWLVGRVLGFGDTPVEGCSLVLMPLALTDEERSLAQGRILFAEKDVINPIAADGSFRAGPALAGRAKVSLQYPQITIHDGPNSSSSSPGATIELGEIEIPAGGEKHQDFDLHGKQPGRVEAQVTVNGARVPDVQVWVQLTEGNSTAIQLDAQGHGISNPIQPGQVTFNVQSNSGHWGWTPPGSWSIESNQTLHVQWDIALAAGTLQIVDEATGLPLAGKQVMIQADTDQFSSVSSTASDEQGKLALQLVPGAYRVQMPYEFGTDGKISPSNYLPARFDWTASGPVNAVLKVGKKP